MTDYIPQIVVGIFASLLATIVWVLVLSRRVERLREHLRTRKEGWSRRRYVRAFVGAVRGRAVAADTYMLAVLFLALIGAFGTTSLWMAEEAKQTFRQWERNFVEVQELLDEVRDDPKTLEDLEAEQDEILRKAEKLFEKMTEESQLIEQSKGPSIWYFRIVGYGLLASSVIAFYFWLPFVVMRRAFAHELDRFALRIQGLASKAELAQIAVAESRVRDEHSLRMFVDLVKGVAERHKVPQLAETFELWDDTNDQA